MQKERLATKDMCLAAGTSKAWYWGSGERVAAPWWCDGQPDADIRDEPVLWLERKQGDHCFHDGGNGVSQKFICEQGEANMDDKNKMFINQGSKKCALKDNDVSV